MFYCITGVKNTFCYIEDFVISRLHGGQKQVLVVQKQIVLKLMLKILKMSKLTLTKIKFLI